MDLTQVLRWILLKKEEKRGKTCVRACVSFNCNGGKELSWRHEGVVEYIPYCPYVCHPFFLVHALPQLTLTHLPWERKQKGKEIHPNP